MSVPMLVAKTMEKVKEKEKKTAAEIESLREQITGKSSMREEVKEPFIGKLGGLTRMEEEDKEQRAKERKLEEAPLPEKPKGKKLIRTIGKGLKTGLELALWGPGRYIEKKEAEKERKHKESEAEKGRKHEREESEKERMHKEYLLSLTPGKKQIRKKGE